MNGRKQFFIVLKGALVKKTSNISVLGAGAFLLLSACGRSDVTSHSTGLWNVLFNVWEGYQGLIWWFHWIRYYFHDLIRAVMIPLIIAKLPLP